MAGDAEPVQVGTLEIAAFSNPAGLRAIGQNLFIQTAASGEPQIGQPGLEQFGEVAQGYLEGSNVQTVEEMVTMITAQRAYEINSKAHFGQ